LSLAGKIHDGLSLYVLTPLWRVQRVARPSTGPTLRAYSRGIRFRRRAATWNCERKQQWLLERLRYTLRYAYQETNFYRQLYDQIGFDPHSDFSFEDFAALPVLNREEVQRRGKEMLAHSVPANHVSRDATGGSTGLPTEVWLGPNERGWAESSTDYFREQLGVPEGARTGLLWGHHLDPQASNSLRDGWTAFRSNTYWFDCMRLSPATLEGYHQEFQRWRPACIIAYASALGNLAEHVMAQGYKPKYPTRCFITGAEKLWSRHRDLIHRAFGKPVHERYGARDTGPLGMQLDPAQTLAFTLDWPKSFVEPEDETPESTVLVTKLQADAMPMIRYRLGDLARFPSGSRPGYPVFTLEEIVGRTTDRIWLSDGRWISGAQIPHLLKDYPVREFLFLQRSDFSVELQIIPQNGFDEESRSEILHTLNANLPGLQVLIKLTDSIIRNKANKWRPVISEVEVPASVTV
jgi:phenylacetate-CoA ligase